MSIKLISKIFNGWNYASSNTWVSLLQFILLLALVVIFIYGYTRLALWIHS